MLDDTWNEHGEASTDAPSIHAVDVSRHASALFLPEFHQKVAAHQGDEHREAALVATQGSTESEHAGSATVTATG